MHIKTLSSPLIKAHDSLYSLLDMCIPVLQEQEIVVITSKIISLTEGSVIHKKDVPSKEHLVRELADAYLPAPSFSLTIKNHLLIPAAGIDESNAEDLYILYPEDPKRSAEKIWNYLRKRDQKREIGVLITDSRTSPFRRGVTGVSLGWCGFKALHNYIGTPDCFGHPLRVTQTNVVDALAASAVLCMGEGNEQTPFAIISQAPQVQFSQETPSEEELKDFYVSLQEDIYSELFQKQWVFNTKPSKEN
ncbi:MAG: coenzyme F420-0:L-glutamate ligase [Verrucomicrobia bacterium]|nr:coenzyme F420-0:L-glutamate ligase [Verrucomicrobiota bacterium]